MEVVYGANKPIEGDLCRGNCIFIRAPIRPCRCWNIPLSTSIHFDSVLRRGGAVYGVVQSNTFCAAPRRHNSRFRVKLSKSGILSFHRKGIKREKKFFFWKKSIDICHDLIHKNFILASRFFTRRNSKPYNSIYKNYERFYQSCVSK